MLKNFSHLSKGRRRKESWKQRAEAQDQRHDQAQSHPLPRHPPRYHWQQLLITGTSFIDDFLEMTPTADFKDFLNALPDRMDLGRDTATPGLSAVTVSARRDRLTDFIEHFFIVSFIAEPDRADLGPGAAAPGLPEATVRLVAACRALSRLAGLLEGGMVGKPAPRSTRSATHKIVNNDDLMATL